MFEINETLKYTVFIILGIITILTLLIIYTFLKLLKMNKSRTIKIDKESENTHNKNLTSISQDFPYTNIEKVFDIPKSYLQKIFLTISNKDIDLIKSVSKTAVLKLANIVKAQALRNQSEYFEDVEIKDVKVLNYEAHGGYKVISYLIKLDYIHFIEMDGEVVNGSMSERVEHFYRLNFVYIEKILDIDQSLLEFEIFGVRCQSCEAEVKILGQKYCEYCRSEIENLNDKRWILLDFEKIWFLLYSSMEN